MAIRIVGVDLPQNKRGEIALTYVYVRVEMSPYDLSKGRIVFRYK